MDELIRWFLTVASILFAVTGLVLLVFPVEVYERAKESAGMKEGVKGLFAQTVTSMYYIKRDRMSADRKHWWHMVWFNTAASAVVSIGITTGLFVILGIIVAVISVILAVVIFGFIMAALGGD